MDKHFFEFWGNSMLNAAKSQEQFEKMADWTQQGFKGFEDMTTMFMKTYGLEGFTKGGTDCVAWWKEAEEEFGRSIRDFMNLFGFVPKSDHLELVKKYEEIKEKLSSQEETIKHLRMLLSEVKMEGQGKLAEQFAHLLRKQNDQFEVMVDNFSKAFKKSSSEKEAEQS